MITIAICDDDQAAMLTLKKQIEKVISRSRFNDLTYQYLTSSTSKKLLSLAEVTPIDILFLDIQLQGESGLKIAKEFQEEHPNAAIIFVSNFESYVFYSMRFRPFRFLRKSKLQDELPEALISVLQYINHPSTTLLLSYANNYEPIQIQKIVYIEKEKKSNYILLHLANKTIKERANLSDMEKTLSKHNFCKINSGTIINIKHVVRAESTSVEMSNRATLQVSNRYAPTLIQQLINFFKQQEAPV